MLGLRLAACGLVTSGLTFFSLVPCSPKLQWKIHHVQARAVTRTQQAAVTSLPALAKASKGQKRKCKHHLVMHIGPHKTGSSAVQTFLLEKRSFLAESFGIFTGTFLYPKDPNKLGSALREVRSNSMMSIKVQKRLKSIAEKILQDVNSRLGKQDIVLSSETLSLWDWQWETLKSRLADSGRCMRLVMVHRRESDQMVSQFAQWEKYSAVPVSFGSFLLYDGPEGLQFNSNSEYFTPDYQVRMWKRASAAAGAVGVSYEYLKESNFSFAAFLICNATLGREGPSWKKCVASIMREESTFDSRTNVSPLPIVLDLVRLAQGFQLQNGCTTTNINKTSEEVKQVAEQMPTACGTFDAQFKRGEDAWFNLSFAARPRIRAQNEEHTFYGMGLAQDLARLAFEFDCVCDGVDFNLRAWKHLEPLKGGLTGLANRVLGTSVEQSKSVTRSNWDKRPLSEQQMTYVAEDAYLSWKVAARMLKVSDDKMQPDWLVSLAEIYGNGQVLVRHNLCVANAVHDWTTAQKEWLAKQDEKGPG
eukprot:Skav215417  [mRNA]  locus=scaffold356:440717:448767:- [translate_table: standard]